MLIDTDRYFASLHIKIVMSNHIVTFVCRKFVNNYDNDDDDTNDHDHDRLQLTSKVFISMLCFDIDGV